MINKKIQKELETTEKDKSELITRLKEMDRRVEMSNHSYKVLQEEYSLLEKTYRNALSDYENKSEQLLDLESQHKKLWARHEEVEKELRTKLMSEREESEKNVKELTKGLTDIQKERNVLLVRVKDALNSRTSNEEYQNHQKSQLNELTIKYAQITEENQKLRRRLELAIEDKKASSMNLEKKTKELDDIKNDFLVKKEELIMVYEGRIKQRDQELMTRQRGTTLNRDTRFSHLGALNIAEQDLLNPEQSYAPRTSNTHLDSFFVPISDRNMPVYSAALPEDLPNIMLKKGSESGYSYHEVMNDINYLVN